MNDVLEQPQEVGELSPGAMLARAREERQLSVAEVAEHLKFGVRQIEALEADEYARLPGATIVRGMIRGYAKLVAVDPAPVLKAFGERNIPAHASVDLRTQRIPFPDGNRRATRLYGALSVIVLLAIAAVLYEWHFSPPLPPPLARSPAVRPAPSAPPAAPAESVSAAPVATATKIAPGTPEAPVTPATPAVPGAPLAPATSTPDVPVTPDGTVTPDAPIASNAPTAPTMLGAPVTAGSSAVAPVAGAAPAGEDAGPRIEFEFQRESWVEIKDRNGRVLFSQLNPAGTRKAVRGEPPFSLVIGNAGGVRLSYKGTPVDLKPYVKTDVARLTLE